MGTFNAPEGALQGRLDVRGHGFVQGRELTVTLGSLTWLEP